MEKYDSLEFRFLEWGEDDDGDDERWHCFKYPVNDHDGNFYVNVIIPVWNVAEEKFNLTLDFGAIGADAHFRIEHLEDDWDKAEKLIAHFLDASTEAGYVTSDVVKEVRDDFDPEQD
jgi:hypothetical protein